MPHAPSFAQILAAADLADGFIAEILDADPALLVGKVAEQDNKDIAKAARKLAEFRKHLIDALAQQPLGGVDVDDDYAYEEDGEDEEEDEDQETVQDQPAPAKTRGKRA
ncbi:hypothetical protein [Pseudorhodoferax soli]|uniref:Uncharacterized protein n=1 Tax=Pseudorhodoferax soli TaxID=545864 RepID=A0A368XLH9_9BURK|nr:hypothetical protein [Pseudorhodoferax soli]RCW68823.1 hypothetical protein DES41_107345 [Pseudorhodoferax soli]